MGTGCINFSPGIQSCCFRIEHDMVFFFFTNVARLCRWVIVSTPIYNPPADCVGFILIFQLPDMITEGCWFIIFLIEACLMLIQPIFETAGSYTGVEFTGLCSCVGYFGSINQKFRLAGPIQGACQESTRINMYQSLKLFQLEQSDTKNPPYLISLTS